MKKKYPYNNTIANMNKTDINIIKLEDENGISNFDVNKGNLDKKNFVENNKGNNNDEERLKLHSKSKNY
jgi:hypothetical protein